MQITVSGSSSDRVAYHITGCTKEALDNKLNLFFSAEGYKLKSANGEIRTYEKGSQTMQLLLGAISKYHKQTVTIIQQGEMLLVLLQRDNNGMAGGLISMNQVKKEFTRLTETLPTYLKN
jgi:hypothetical protein